MPGFAIAASVALKSSAVLAAAWLAARLLRRRSAALRHLVWTAALSAILLLPLLITALPQWRVPLGGSVLPDIHVVVREPAPPAATHLAAHTPMPVSSTGAPWRADWQRALLLLWAAGTLLSLGRAAWAYGAAWRVYRSSTWKQTYGGAEVRHCAPGSMPMAMWLGRPVILLPAQASQWSEDRRSMVLQHELAHLDRGDVWTQLLACAALAVYWWNPLAWTAWREFLKERERAADDRVLQSGAKASDYAGGLLEVAREFQGRSAAWAAPAMARRSQLEGRLLAILDSGTDRGRAGRSAVAASILATVLLTLPLAALRAQEMPRVPADVDATIRTAQSQNNYAALDRAAQAATEADDIEAARKLLEAALRIREKSAGPQSPEYAAGLIRLAELAQKQNIQAGNELLSKATQILGGRPEAGVALIDLGTAALARNDDSQAFAFFQYAESIDPAGAPLARMWMAVVRQHENNMTEADRLYLSALSAGPSSRDRALIARVYSGFLRSQKRDDEADGYEAGANFTRSVPPLPAGVSRVGDGVLPPSVEHKIEPSYSEPARLAGLQGTVVLQVVIGTDGRVQRAAVIRELGLGLDEKALEAIHQWQFKPGMKDGQPVPVAATIEVNFRLL